VNVVLIYYCDPQIFMIIACTVTVRHQHALLGFLFSYAVLMAHFKENLKQWQ